MSELFKCSSLVSFLPVISFTTILLLPPPSLPPCLFLIFLFICCYLLCTVTSYPSPFLSPCLSSLFLKWMLHRGHAHSLYPCPEHPVLSSPFSCTFWHLLDLLLLLWSPTSVPQPRRCPPLCPPWLGPCPSVQPVRSTYLAPPRGERRWCADVWHLLLPGRSWKVRV